MLVTTDQFDIFLNRIDDPLDPDVSASRIRVASGLIGGFCNRVSFERIEDDEITVPGTFDARLELPGAPVEDVTAVTIDGVATSAWNLVGNALVRDGSTLDVPRPHRGWGGPGVSVGVTLTHGYPEGEAPEDVQGSCLLIAAMIHANPTLARQLSIDGYSATWGGLSFSHLKRYRVTSRSAQLA